ncbi:MAG: hypothetical protein HRT87_11970, partial [Legionellales bacterium]|nr:hypothetical protein [Legionellales bacterium]
MANSVDQILENEELLKVFDTFTAYSSEQELYNYSRGIENLDREGISENFYYMIKGIQNLMLREGCYSFSELAELSELKKDGGKLKNELDREIKKNKDFYKSPEKAISYINSLDSNSQSQLNASEYVKTELELEQYFDKLSNNFQNKMTVIEGQKEYLKMIMKMIKMGLPGTSPDPLFDPHKEAILAVKEVIDENIKLNKGKDLDYDSDPEIILSRLNLIGNNQGFKAGYKNKNTHINFDLNDPNKSTMESPKAKWDKAFEALYFGYLENYADISNSTVNQTQSQQSGIQRILTNPEHINIVDVFVTYYDKFQFETVLENLKSPPELFFHRQIDNRVTTSIKSIKNLMNNHKCHSFKEIIDLSNTIDDNGALKNTLNTHINDLYQDAFDNPKYYAKLKAYTAVDSTKYKQLSNYIQILVKMIQKDLPQSNSTDEMINVHKDSKDAFKQFMDSHQDLNLNMDPKVLTDKYLAICQREDLGNQQFDNREDNLDEVFAGLVVYEGLPENQKQYLKRKCQVPISNDMSQVNSQSSNLEQGIGVSLNSGNTSDIKAKFKASLQKLQTKSEINSFTEPAIKNIKNKDYYETTV